MTITPSKFICAALALASLPTFASDSIPSVQHLPVAKLDASLPRTPLETWLAEVGGVKKDAIQWEVNDCGEGGDGREAPTCAEAILLLQGGVSAHLSLAVADIHGKAFGPSVWDMSIGSGTTFTGFRSLPAWATSVRGHRR